MKRERELRNTKKGTLFSLRAELHPCYSSPDRLLPDLAAKFHEISKISIPYLLFIRYQLSLSIYLTTIKSTTMSHLAWQRVTKRSSVTLVTGCTWPFMKTEPRE